MHSQAVFDMAVDCSPWGVFGCDLTVISSCTMHKFLKTMLLWMLLLALPLQTFALAGHPSCAASAQMTLDQQSAQQLCDAHSHAHHDRVQHGNPHDNQHATGGACAAGCPAASQVAVAFQSSVLAPRDAQCGSIAYASAYLPHVVPEPPEPPPRVFSL